jgi:SPP1 family phage portal protein
MIMACENKNVNSGTTSPVIRNDMFGRLDIFSTFDEITEENVMEELNSALVYHVGNMLQEEFLYWYRRGVQPILNRTKEVRDDILNKVQENHAAETVDFKNGYFLTQAAYYQARRRGVQVKLKKLNEFLYVSGKQDADNTIADWFHTVGKGVCYVEPNDDDKVPFKAYALDPRSAFVVYSLRPGNKPIMGVNFVTVDGTAKFDVFTEQSVFHLSGAVVGKMTTAEKNHDYLVTANSLDSVEPNVLGKIPIIEYRYNTINQGCFEAGIPILDEINNIVSNACDGIEQFIQSLAIAVNCEFPEDTTITDIRKAGMISLRSVGENKADFKVLSEQLDQTQTKVLVDRLYDQYLRICAMPSRSNGSTTYDTTGAAVLANFGWYQADCAKRNTIDLFKKSNRQFDEIVVEILSRKNLLDIDVNDFELEIVSNETANVQSKAQAFNTLLAAGMHPELAAAKSGISNDPVKDMKMSDKYLKMVWGDPDAKAEEEKQAEADGNLTEEENASKGEAEIVEDDADNGENETGGAA